MGKREGEERKRGREGEKERQRGEGRDGREGRGRGREGGDRETERIFPKNEYYIVSRSK